MENYWEKLKKNRKCKMLVKDGENFIKEDFINPHLNNKNEDKNNNNNNILGDIDKNEYNFNNVIEENVTEENNEEIEKKIVKNIQESNSGSNQDLMRHYKKVDNFPKNDFIGNINELDEFREINNAIENDIVPDDED